MSEFSRELIARSGYAEPGFAERYDRARPAPPAALLDILCHVAQVERARLVVDLGAGTGLSSRAWAGRADEVVGVEANPAMAEQARAATTAPNVRFVVATADATGLEGGRADLVTCAQSFHWMEPQAVLAEAARLLRRGGVFAAYDYDWPPAIHPDLDAAFDVHQEARAEARRRLRIEAGAATWPKEEHLAQIRASGRFRVARELVCHGWDSADAERAIELTRSIGGPHEIFGGDAPDVRRTFEELSEVARRVLGDRTAPMLLGYRIRLGVL
ncbi:MAG TPA: class I SAM-dependent methyltransferase [Gaiellaceae bacterium]|nr:class I SAM-dependent methyltransferase [Gaiellaceae bacterium]